MSIMNLRKELKTIPLIKLLSSLKITVTCLLILFALTFWGTVAQVENGLYAAQERYFNSLFFLAFGFIPMPGARLVLWILFINLAAATVMRFVFRWQRAGILIIHGGLLLYFVAAFVTFHGSVDSQVTIMEGGAANVSTAYHQWELSVWKSSGPHAKTVTAISADHFHAGQTFPLNQEGLTIRVQAYYPNSEAYTAGPAAPKQYVSASGIAALKEIPLNKEPERNLPGGIFQITGKNGEQTVLLYGAEVEPARLASDAGEYFVQLRRKRHPLPFLLTLKDFRKEIYPNTDVARSYESLVEISNEKVGREVLISMNEPLRYKDYTLYQASFTLDEMGRESSTLAVVKNTGRLLPYIASLLTFAGLAFHFLAMALTGKRFQ